MTPIVYLRGQSGSGKTTLLLALIPELAACGYVVSVVKHAHHVTEFDVPGKDSHRLREAGAAAVLVGGSGQAAVFFPADTSGWDESDFRRLLPECDLILVEGYKQAPASRALVFTGETVSAVVDGETAAEFDRDDAEAIGGWLASLVGPPGVRK